jgi:hypothetical protein
MTIREPDAGNPRDRLDAIDSPAVIGVCDSHPVRISLLY